MTPWMSPEEVAAIARRINKSTRVLEWGSGGSSIEFSKLSGEYISIEHDPEWAERVSSEARRQGIDNLFVRIAPSGGKAFQGPEYPSDYFDKWREYVEFPARISEGKFDAILIDGRARLFCARKALSLLNRDGVVFIHDFFQRPRYNAVLERYNIIESIMTNQTLAILQPK